MTGYYALQLQLDTKPGDWFTLTYWSMEEHLLPDFLLHVLDLHHSIECRDDLRVKRIHWRELFEAGAANPDLEIYEYHGLHLHTCP